jgi:hypothetical protein
MKLRYPVLVCFLLATVGAPVVCGQADQGAITGTVTDPSGAVVPNASVSLIHEGTNLNFEATTDSSGVYSFQPVKIGRYAIRVAATGFATVEQTGIELHAAQKLGVNLALKLGTEKQTVEVAAEDLPLLQTEDASTGQVFNDSQINNVPLNGRNYVFIAHASAGVYEANGSRGQGGGDFNANGQKETQNNFILDGVDNNSNAVDFLNGASYVVRPPPDALQEFTVQTGNTSAEFGHSAGAVVNASIKSGANQFHGDLWEYFRNDALDAQDLFSPTKPEYRENQFGGTLGGPILRNRLFFFVDSEANRVRLGTVQQATVPTLQERAGNFSQLLNTSLTGAAQPIYLYEPGSAGTIPMTACGQNVLCPSQIDPVAQKLIDLYPPPNANGGLLYNNYVATPTATDNTRQFDVRVDYNIRPADLLFARFSYSDEDFIHPPVLGGLADGGANGYAIGGATGLNYGLNGVVSETHLFSPTLVNEFRVSREYGHFGNWQSGYSQNVAAQYGLGGIPFNSVNGGLPALGISGYTSMGGGWWTPGDEHENVWEFLDNVTKVEGNHTVKVGVAFQKIGYSTYEPTLGRGGYTFSGKYTGSPGVSFTGNGAADFLTDSIDSAEITPNDISDNWRWYDAAYVQEHWKATPKLSIDAGLRYDYFQPPWERYDHVAAFVNTGPFEPGAGTGLYLMPASQRDVPLDPLFVEWLAEDHIQLQYTSNRSLLNAQKTNFAPRIGVAYAATDKLVVRTGFGIYYGGLENLGNAPNLGTSYPYSNWENFPSVGGCGVAGGKPVCPTNGMTLETGFNSTVMSPYPGMVGAQQTVQTLYTEAYNFTVQYEVLKGTALTAGYVGNVGRHIPVYVTPNGSTALVAPGVSTIPYQAFPLFGSIGYIQDSADSNYNSLQTTLQRRLAGGLSFLAAYTWSHSRDNDREPLPDAGEGGYRSYPIVGLQPEYSNSTFDVRQRFSWIGTYELPFGKGRRFANGSRLEDTIAGGWAVAPNFQAQTGQPFTVSSDIATADGATAFPYLVSDPFVGGGTPNSTNPGIACPATVRDAAHWYNPCAFSNPPAATTIAPGQVVQGQAALAYLGSPRNQIYGPGFFRLDASVFKNFYFAESKYVQFRSDIFNITNTPSLGQPNGGLGSNGGQITTTRFLGAFTPNARFFQFALKVYF